MNLRNDITSSQICLAEHAAAARVHATLADQGQYSDDDALAVLLFVRHQTSNAFKHSMFRKTEGGGIFLRQRLRGRISFVADLARCCLG